MGVDPWGFDSGRQALARRLRSKRLWLRAIRTVVFVLLAGGLVLGGAAALRDFIVGLRGPDWASLVVFLVVLFALFAAAEIPFGYVGGFRWERASEMSTQSVSSWLKDLLKSLGLGLASTVVAGGVLVWLLGRTPLWWLLAWALGVCASAVLGFLSPVLLVPLFYRLRPIRDASLRARLGALAERARVPVTGVFEMQASRKTKRSNAAVMGVGRTRRIVVTDTLLQDFPVEEIDSVLAHELAHQRHRDPILGFLLGSTSSLAIIAVAAWVYSASYAAVGIRAPADMAGLPFLVVLFSLVSLPLRPFELRWSREREARADRFALGLTGDPTAFQSAMVRLHDRNLGVANPSRWEKWLFYSHPTGRERVELARAAKAAGE